MNWASKFSKAIRLLALYPAISHLPMGAAYALARFISPMDRAFRTSYMAQWKQGIQRINTKKQLVPASKLDACVKEHLTMLSWEAVDTCLVPRLTPERMKTLSRISGLEHIREALKLKKGLIIVTSHFCRLNMTAYTLGHLGIKNGILSQVVDKDNPHLDWVDRIYLTKKLQHYYRLTGGTGLTLKDNPRLIYRALERNEIMVILMDAFPHTIRNFYEVPFLGGTLKLPKGIARISQRTGAPLVYSVVKPRSEWKVSVELRPINGTGEEGFREACKELEKDVKALPCQWWQWPYMHTMWN